MDTFERIKNLLMQPASSTAMMPGCLSSLAEAVEEHPMTRAIPLKQVRSIYRVRAKINQDNGSPIIGFDELLHQMDTATDEAVCISSFLAPAGRFIVFTDASMETLIGVLFTPAHELSQRPTKQTTVRALA